MTRSMKKISIKDYKGIAKDKVENFHGKQLVYIGWDKHSMFCAPVCYPLPPEMPFAALVEQIIPAAFSVDPQFAQIDWDDVKWSINQQPCQPDFSKSLTDNGIGHKSVIRMVTPGLNGFFEKQA